MSTGSAGIGASAAANACSVLNNLFWLAGIWLIIGPSGPPFDIAVAVSKFNNIPSFDYATN
jgi:hypothetical protein